MRSRASCSSSSASRRSGSPLSNLLVDRVRRRPLLVVTNLATAAMVLLLLLVHGRGDVWIVYLVTFLYGVSFTVLGAAQSALLTVLLPDELLPDGNGALQTTREAIRLIGPVTGAGLFAWVGGAVVAVVDAGTFVAAAGLLLAMRVPEATPVRSEEPRWLAEVAAGIRHILDTVVLRQLVAATGLALLVVGFTETIAFAVVDQGLHRPPSFLGVVMTVQGVGAVTGGLCAAPALRRVGEGVLVGAGMAVFAAGAPLLMLSRLPGVLVGTAVIGFSIPWIVVGFYTLLQRRTPAHLQGRVYAAAETLVGTPQTVSIALGAALTAVVDYRVLLAVMAIVLAVAAAYLLTRPEQRRRAAASPPATLEVTSPR